MAFRDSFSISDGVLTGNYEHTEAGAARNALSLSAFHTGVEQKLGTKLNTSRRSDFSNVEPQFLVIPDWPDQQARHNEDDKSLELPCGDSASGSATLPHRANAERAETSPPGTVSGDEGSRSTFLARLNHKRDADEQEVCSDTFNAVAKDIIARIAPDGHGVTREQLARALEEPSHSDAEAQVLASLYANFGKLHLLSRHNWNDRDKLNSSDLDVYHQIEDWQNSRLTGAIKMQSWSKDHLAVYGRNGFLSYQNVSTAIENPSTSPEDKAVLESIKQHWRELVPYGYGPANQESFDAYAWRMWSGTPEAKLISDTRSTCIRVAHEAQRTTVSRDLFGTANPLDSISPDDIRQGSISDCYFEGPLSAVARTHPESIRDAIKDNHDGTYTVTFPGAPDKPVSVKAPSEAELGLYNGGGKDGVWAAVMEKAFGQFKIDHHDFFLQDSSWTPNTAQERPNWHPNTPQEGAGGSGYAATAIKLLTGHPADDIKVAGVTQADMAQRFEAAFAAKPGSAVTACINIQPAERSVDGFYTRHVYAITDFKSDGHGGGIVTLRNPWAGAPGTPDGTMQVPLSIFTRNFTNVQIEQTR